MQGVFMDWSWKNAMTVISPANIGRNTSIGPAEAIFLPQQSTGW